MIYRGMVHKLGEHIDTDAIIPARYLVTFDPEELGRKCMDGLEEGWVNRVNPGDIIVAGRNFGCGSSREHAPVAILGAGMQVVVAHSFARIFYRNAFNRGLMLVELGDAVNEIADGDEIEIDTEAGSLKIISSGKDFSFTKLPAFISRLVQGGGLIPYVRNRLEAEQA
ncbi:MAG: 3-isopropylmalate dehydratase small subunit [Desulfovibrionaceae bacterium]|nr:3-isopropylmalate dehydratase small subunit [Desulfovibrionaceae bacterium]